MTVVADTSPLNYLVIIDEIAVLPALFGSVLIPHAVIEELQHRRTSTKVRDWIACPPTWLELRTVTPNPALILPNIDPGERAAIQLAIELQISTILIDDAAGRRQAEELGLEARGTLGILERSARLGFTNFHTALSKLERTNFRVSPAVKAAFLVRNPARDS